MSSDPQDPAADDWSSVPAGSWATDPQANPVVLQVEWKRIQSRVLLHKSLLYGSMLYWIVMWALLHPAFLLCLVFPIGLAGIRNLPWAGIKFQTHSLLLAGYCFWVFAGHFLLLNISGQLSHSTGLSHAWIFWPLFVMGTMVTLTGGMALLVLMIHEQDHRIKEIRDQKRDLRANQPMMETGMGPDISGTWDEKDGN